LLLGDNIEGGCSKTWGFGAYLKGFLFRREFLKEKLSIKSH
jgi:hypothetical protein